MIFTQQPNRFVNQTQNADLRPGSGKQVNRRHIFGRVIPERHNDQNENEIRQNRGKLCTQHAASKANNLVGEGLLSQKKLPAFLMSSDPQGEKRSLLMRQTFCFS